MPAVNEQPLADLDRAIKLPTVTINAPRQTVWQFLTNPEQLTQCAPGLESLEVITPEQSL